MRAREPRRPTRRSVDRGVTLKVLATLFFAAGLLAPAIAPADQIVKLKTRAEATQSYLLLVDGTAPPKAVAVLFPGGEGRVGLPDDISRLKLGLLGNFLVRTRDLFRDSETAVALVDVPSDREGGMDDGFRSGREHGEDIAAVIKDLRARFPRVKIFLVGTSRGTLSAAHAGRTLGGAVDGVVLTSSVLRRRNGYSLSGFEFSAIKAPLLFVHHADDGCRVCPYRDAEALGRTFPLVTVHGGKPAESGACEGLSAHGYFGKEAETVAAIKNWMLGRPYPRSIE